MPYDLLCHFGRVLAIRRRRLFATRFTRTAGLLLNRLRLGRFNKPAVFGTGFRLVDIRLIAFTGQVGLELLPIKSFLTLVVALIATVSVLALLKLAALFHFLLRCT